jgi:hypothetical protein
MTSTKKPNLTGSQDLLTYFNLIPIYNKVVKPFPPPNRAAGLDPSLFPYISDLPGKRKKKLILITITLTQIILEIKRQNGYGA